MCFSSPLPTVKLCENIWQFSTHDSNFKRRALLNIKITLKFFSVLISFSENILASTRLGKENISVLIFWAGLLLLPKFHLLAEVQACWKLKCLHCRTDHYNSTHAALVEKNHGFGTALLRVRNVKQSSYFRLKWEPELILANTMQLSCNKWKRIPHWVFKCTNEEVTDCLCLCKR